MGTHGMTVRVRDLRKWLLCFLILQMPFVGVSISWAV